MKNPKATMYANPKPKPKPKPHLRFCGVEFKVIKIESLSKPFGICKNQLENSSGRLVQIYFILKLYQYHRINALIIQISTQI